MCFMHESSIDIVSIVGANAVGIASSVAILSVL